MLLILLEQHWLSEGDTSLAKCCFRLYGQMTLWQYLAAFNPLIYGGGKNRQTKTHIMKATDLFKSSYVKSALLNLGIFKATSRNV